MVEHPTPVCPGFARDFSDFVDGHLPAARHAELQAHLDCCERCLQHLTAYRKGVESLRGAREGGLDIDAFWACLEHRIWHVDFAEPTTRSGWRMPALTAGAIAAVALAMVWVGSRIEIGFDRMAEGARRPVVVVAEPPSSIQAPVGSVVEIASAPRGGAARLAPSRRTPVVTTGTAGAASVADAALEREFEDLRTRLETDAGVDEANPASPSVRIGFRSGPRPIRIDPVDVRHSEPIPVGWATRSFTTP
jgi:hypothetical protein